ncbi:MULTISPECIES: L-threonylcarbamoyladenylate synthase [unclassified Thauera]|uniref:L-threonylcarbamoyladenylate synthase n=1 Tax=unclassified Thauera TaxID=2609274 RepID=UPI0002D06DF5|nr:MULTISPECIES: L-threonylcarbamoyladenylate synthase [unclassified Thauera]ENO93541.1 Sua5/YciO/YrdC/YwlC family protein [Thauera sp. 28]WBL62942.1 threonylcarbamoyl-AMP synthase [Thauera sp. WB-2]HAG75899.1 threonylcarbamoyl-AMP synthase [Thauera sp.]HNR60239.1 L-threonylcarbamoyladenylate synthase [Thauera sp.]HNS91734.1 L-threonylcarbamoyladenylate synthase [Thauera sp.]
MAQFFSLHPEQPQARLIRQAAEIIRRGGLVVLPTDSAYALVCQMGDAGLLERIRRLRGVDERHHFTLMCRDLSEIGTYARVDNGQYRLLKATTPGPYTFILEGTKELPRRVLHPKRKTIGLRVPEHAVVSALLAEIDGPLLTSTLILPGETLPMSDADEIRERLEKQVELIIEAGYCGPEATTVIDLTSGAPELVRAGRGALEPFGL